MGACPRPFAATAQLLPNVAEGTVIQWTGNPASIPPGWYLCDGSNGTPDLRDKFIVGAGDAYNVADSGGVAVHTHTFQDATHYHSVSGGAVIDWGTERVDEIDETQVTGTTDEASTLPPYFALCFLMKGA